jgi:hypothetical protein
MASSAIPFHDGIRLVLPASQRVDDRALSASSALYTAVDMKLPSDPITRKFRFSFEKSAHLAILSLPPAYNTSTNRATFKAFIQRYSISISCSCLQSPCTASFVRSHLAVEGTVLP